MAAEPLIVIVGPTASGKTSLAVEIALELGGEVISADSRAIYGGMDIGTAKPTADDMRGVTHWGIDIVEPGESFTAADFKKYADAKIKDVMSRGKVPILVGGSGLYIDAVVYDYEFGGDVDPKLRGELDKLDVESLHKYCISHNIELPENNKNKRYLIRAIEQKGVNNKRQSSIKDNVFIYGLRIDSEVIKQRIADRFDEMLKQNVVDETSMLIAKYGRNMGVYTGSVYRPCIDYIDGAISLDELKQRVLKSDMKLVKKQNTWFRRNKYINWCDITEVKLRIIDDIAAYMIK
jgi:tRNA dimethylallyltransferase